MTLGTIPEDNSNNMLRHYDDTGATFDFKEQIQDGTNESTQSKDSPKSISGNPDVHDATNKESAGADNAKIRIKKANSDIIPRFRNLEVEYSIDEALMENIEENKQIKLKIAIADNNSTIIHVDAKAPLKEGSYTWDGVCIEEKKEQKGKKTKTKIIHTVITSTQTYKVILVLTVGEIKVGDNIEHIIKEDNIVSADERNFVISPPTPQKGYFWSEDGKVIGNDGVSSNKVYVIKNETLSKKDYEKTINFIKNNSGNRGAFNRDNIAYTNSIEIEGSYENRQAMFNIVSLDNGKGGIKPKNNREYGGYIENGIVRARTPGIVGDPEFDKSIPIRLPSGFSTFHSHPSGTKLKNLYDEYFKHVGTRIFSWEQKPSPTDINTSESFTHYVFARGDKIVYIYNSEGIQASIPLKSFINPKK